VRDVAAQGGSSAQPPWLAWRVFHQILEARASDSNARVSTVMSAQFGITSAATSALVRAGNAYLRELEDIDKEARARLEQRLPTVRAGKGDVPIQSVTTRLQVAKAIGLYDQVEARKKAALGRHVALLRRAMSDRQFVAIENWVLTSIAPHIGTLPERPEPTPPALAPAVK
jgi:hypothetical protein